MNANSPPSDVTEDSQMSFHEHLKNEDIDMRSQDTFSPNMETIAQASSSSSETEQLLPQSNFNILSSNVHQGECTSPTTAPGNMVTTEEDVEELERHVQRLQREQAVLLIKIASNSRSLNCVLQENKALKAEIAGASKLQDSAQWPSAVMGEDNKSTRSSSGENAERAACIKQEP